MASTELPITDPAHIRDWLEAHAIKSSSSLSPGHMQLAQDLGMHVCVLILNHPSQPQELSLFHIEFHRDWDKLKEDHSPDFYQFYLCDRQALELVQAAQTQSQVEAEAHGLTQPEEDKR